MRNPFPLPPNWWAGCALEILTRQSAACYISRIFANLFKPSLLFWNDAEQVFFCYITVFTGLFSPICCRGLKPLEKWNSLQRREHYCYNCPRFLCFLPTCMQACVRQPLLIQAYKVVILRKFSTFFLLRPEAVRKNGFSAKVVEILA